MAMVGGYAGELGCREAFETLSHHADAVLVDVRTDAEWAYVGLPDLSDAAGAMMTQSWQLFPTMQVDPDFATTLDARLSGGGLGKDATLLFLCRSGVRSLAAARAMTAMGYANSHNVTHGFEGDPDGERHRGRINGWKADGLPWVQG